MPENEEPDGPNLPPKKKSALISEVKTDTTTKSLETRGIIAAVVSAFMLVSYVFYYYYYYTNEVKLSELYFISTGVGVSVFTGLLFTFFKRTWVKTLLLFTSTFYAILELIYIIMWIILGKPYAYIKWSLIAGLAVGLIYFIYDSIKNDS
jgi:hypothetical protein